MSFLIRNDELLEKCNGILEKKAAIVSKKNLIKNT